MSETDVSMCSFNNRAELRHGFRFWFRSMREGCARVVVDRENFATDFLQRTRNQPRTGTVAAIDRDLQPALLDRLNIKNVLEQLYMVLDWVLKLYGRLDLVPGSLGKFSLMEYVQELFGLHGIQIKSITAHKFERVPLRWIVTGGDCDATIRFEPCNR